jgi:hypothetical protein
MAKHKWVTLMCPQLCQALPCTSLAQDKGNELRETSFSGGLQLLLTNLRKASKIRRSDRVVLSLKGMIKEQYCSPKLTRRVIGGE